MIVAATALIVALAGTAMAAPTAIKSILNKKEKKQVKNIANNRINALAPGLSVKHANTAGTADTAKRADDANAIGGVELKDISVAKSANPGAQCDPSSSTFVDCATVNLTLPHEGRVLLIGSAALVALSNSQTDGDCLFRVDGANSGGAVRVGNQYAPVPFTIVGGARDFGNGFSTTVVTDPIPAGAHEFKLVCNQLSAGDIEFESPALVAVLVGSGG
jgi:hypothetical protein